MAVPYREIDMKPKQALRRGAASLVILAAAAGIAAQTASAADTGRGALATPISLDDLLRIESFRGGAIASDGSRFAYQIGAAAADLGGRSYDASGYDDLTVRVVEAATGASTEIRGEDARDRFGLAPWGSAFSPSGRYLALRAAHLEHAGMAIWDVRQRRVRRLPGGLSGYFVANAWTPDDRLIYAAAAEGGGERSGIMMAQALERRWRAAAEGRAPQVTVTSAHPAVASSEGAHGKLMLASADGKAVELADGDYTMVSVAPDGARFAAIRRAGPSKGATFDGEAKRGELQVYTLTPSGATREAAFPDHDVSPLSLAWSADGSQLLVAGTSSASAERVRLFRYRAASPALETVATADLVLQDPSVVNMLEILPRGWLGSTPLTIGATAADGAGPAGPAGTGAAPDAGGGQGVGLDYGEYARLRFDLWAVTPAGPRNLTAFARAGARDLAVPEGERAAFVVADGALWRVAPETEPERVTPADGPMVLGFAPPPGLPARQAFSAAATDRRVNLMIAGAAGAAQAVFDLRTRGFSTRAEDGRLVAATPDFGRMLVQEGQGGRQSLMLHAGPQATEVARINAFLEERTPGEAVSFPYRVGGAELTAWAIKPPGMKPGERRPAVVSVYGGMVWGPAAPPPFAGLGQKEHVFNGQLLAAEGYVVLYPSLPLKPGKEADIPALLAEATVAAVDAAVERGLVDAERVAVMGQSFGGYSTAAILSRTGSRFKAGIALAGIYSWPTVYAARALDASLQEGTGGWMGSILAVERGQIGLQVPPWEAPDAYVRNSPLFRAGSIDAPLMIMQGDRDIAMTSLYGAEQMYSALVHAGKRPVLVRYWGESHVVSGRANIADQWRRIVDWLALHLQ